MTKTILLTGASSGIGRATADLLSQNGFKIIATVRKEEDKTSLESINKNIKCLLLDVTNSEDIKHALSLVKEETEELYAIINNAGQAYTGIVEYANIEEIKQQFAINTLAPLEITKTFLPMIKHGKIINISSVSSNVVYQFISPYCASKKALDIFFQALALEMDNPNIKIVSIKPGIVKTPIWQKSLDAAYQRMNALPDEAKEKYQKKLNILLEKVRKSIKYGKEPQDVANLILKVLNKKNPKLSYNLGLGAHIGELLSKFSPDFQCFILKCGEKYVEK